MRKNLIKVAVLAGLGLVGQLAATDFRTPIATQMGPLHYSFDKLHKKKSNFSYFTTSHFRETTEAFMKHGTESHPLSQLIFGKADFTVGQAFQGGNAADNASTTAALDNYNPYLDVVRIAPRVSYTEAGVFLGAKWDYPVWNNKGRIGIRGSLPLRWVRMERDDQAEFKAVGHQDSVIKDDQRYVAPFDAAVLTLGAPVRTINPTNATLNDISSYRLKLLKSLKYIDGTGAVLSYYRTDANGVVTLGDTYDAAANKYGSIAAKVPFVLINSSTKRQPPSHKGGALLVGTHNVSPEIDGRPANVEQLTTHILYPTAAINANSMDVQLEALGTDGSITEGRAAAFVKGTDYSSLDPDHLWVTTIHGYNKEPIDTSADRVEEIDNYLSPYSDDVEQWLYEHNFVMATNEQTGLADIPLEIFYEHSFNDSWRGELCVGVLFPTGNGGSDYSANPFRVQMGKGSHWEIKLGALAAWQALRCMNVKLDLSYNFALEATEQRKAAFKGAKIKNFGPRADANVDWGYFIGNLDFNFTHPKSKKINGMIGYQLYYKTEDYIKFKHKTANDWLNIEQPLDNKVARMDTEQWAHRIRMEGSYNLSKYCTTSVGGLYTVAGQYMPVEADVHVACQIRF